MKLRVQIFLARGVGLYINGKEPVGDWSSGETDNDKGITCRTSHEQTWLAFKEFKLDRFEFNITGASTFWAWEDGPTPPWKKFETVTLFTDKGTFVLPITEIKTGDPDAEEFEKVRVGRKSREVDEITLYIRAEGNAKPAQS